MTTALEQRVLDRLARGPATFSELHVSIPHGFRKLDGAVQKLRRRGLIVSLPRVRGVRAIAQWSLVVTCQRMLPGRHRVRCALDDGHGGDCAEFATPASPEGT